MGHCQTARKRLGDVLGGMIDIPGALNSVVDTLSNLSASDVLDGVQGVLDVVGLVPGFGEIADGINGVISLARGDYVGAALSFTSMIPIVGDAIGKSGKVARAIANKADDVLAIGRKIKCKVTGTGCFVAGTQVWLTATTEPTSIPQPHRASDRFLTATTSAPALTLAPPSTITKQSIESVAIGSRVAGDNPRPWEYDGELPDPDRSTWQLATFSLQKEGGNWVDVEMIRPAAYWESQQAVPGNYVFMEFPELEASGIAKIKSLELCPPIASGSGNVVTARIVTRQVSDLVELTIEGGETITGTPQHPIWSIERQDWVELGDLEEGEHLWTEDGPVEVQSVRLLSTAESVYNIEVHGHHIYQVGDVGVLVHNACHKNSNKARGTFAIYEIYVNGVLRKVGKAAANAGRLTKNGRPSRLESQVRKLKEKYSDVKGTIVKTMKNTSTRLAKVAEKAQIAKRVAQNEAAGKVGKNAIPFGNRRSYKP